MDFDKVLESVGGFGRYQKLYFILCGLAAVPMGAMSFANVFIAGTPLHWCVVPYDNVTGAVVANGNGGAHTNDTCGYFDNGVTAASYGYDGNTTTTRGCESWTYDTAVYSDTIVTRVS